MHTLFGTDGIRGTPGEYPLTDEMLTKIGSAIAHFVIASKPPQGKVKAVIGKDTRLSGSQIEELLSKPLKDHGIDVLLAGTITTPGLSYMVKQSKADVGIMISASHNKPSDNGIKCFDANGYKLLSDAEAEIESYVFDDVKRAPKVSRGKGKTYKIKDVPAKYLKLLLSAAPGLSLGGCRIALDCACGAASLYAKKLFTTLGATIYSINDTPSGDSINTGGAINPHFLKELVLRTKAHIGVALDGDGDRGVMVDEKGRVLDGDYILAIIARHLMSRNELKSNTVVTTVMANCGLKAALESVGAKMLVTSVGDKYVLEALLKHGLNIGGEQSGHIIFSDYLTTPDGMLTALQILRVMRETKMPLSKLADCMKKFPQILVNVKVKEKKPFESIPAVHTKISRYENALKNDGRILLRYSGTELLARVMVEGPEKEMIETIAHDLADEIRQAIGCEE